MRILDILPWAVMVVLAFAYVVAGIRLKSIRLVLVGAGLFVGTGAGIISRTLQ